MAEEVLWVVGVAIVGMYLAALLQGQGVTVASQHLSLVLGAVVLGSAVGLLFVGQ